MGKCWSCILWRSHIGHCKFGTSPIQFITNFSKLGVLRSHQNKRGMTCNRWEMDEISQIAKMLTMFHGCICDLLDVMSTHRVGHIRCQIIPKIDEIERNAGDFMQTRHELNCWQFSLTLLRRCRRNRGTGWMKITIKILTTATKWKRIGKKIRRTRCRETKRRRKGLAFVPNSKCC